LFEWFGGDHVSRNPRSVFVIHDPSVTEMVAPKLAKFRQKFAARVKR
jgi:hypothetical protein